MFLEWPEFMIGALSNNNAIIIMKKNTILYFVLAVLTFISCLFFIFVQMPIYLAVAASASAKSAESTGSAGATTLPTAIPKDFAGFVAKPPLHTLFAASTSPQGLVPS